MLETGVTFSYPEEALCKKEVLEMLIGVQGKRLPVLDNKCFYILCPIQTYIYNSGGCRRHIFAVLLGNINTLHRACSVRFSP